MFTVSQTFAACNNHWLLNLCPAFIINNFSIHHHHHRCHIVIIIAIIAINVMIITQSALHPFNSRAYFAFSIGQPSPSTSSSSSSSSSVIHIDLIFLEHYHLWRKSIMWFWNNTGKSIAWLSRGLGIEAKEICKYAFLMSSNPKSRRGWAKRKLKNYGLSKHSVYRAIDKETNKLAGWFCFLRRCWLFFYRGMLWSWATCSVFHTLSTSDSLIFKAIIILQI